MRRWYVLGAGTFVQCSQSAAYSGLAVLAPDLRDRYDLSLTQIGVLLGGTGIGALLTMLAWGLAADRISERVTATTGLLGAAGGLASAAYAPGYVSLIALLFLAGAFGASTNTATGRAVTSWFPRAERGFALGVRQTAVPLGGVIAAFVLPPISDQWGSRGGLLALAIFSFAAAVAAVALIEEGPVRDIEDESDALRHPLRDGRVWRVSNASALLIVTQVAVTGFIVLFLESQRGFSHGEAAAVLGGMNAVAAVGRLVAGRISDRMGSRVELIIQIAVAAAVVLAVAAALVDAPGWALAPAFVLGGGLVMSWNALSVTAVVEFAGPRRSGAALGLQQTLLQMSVVAAPLAFAPFVEKTSWQAAFAAAAAFPLAAALVLRPLTR